MTPERFSSVLSFSDFDDSGRHSGGGCATEGARSGAQGEVRVAPGAWSFPGLHHGSPPPKLPQTQGPVQGAATVRPAPPGGAATILVRAVRPSSADLPVL